MEDEFKVKILNAMGNMANNVKGLREDLTRRVNRLESRVKELVYTAEELQTEFDKVKEQVRILMAEDK